MRRSDAAPCAQASRRYAGVTAVAVHAVSPYSGPVSGGTVVRVHGEHFTADAALACRFGDASVSPAVFESEGVVSCVAPEAPSPGKVTIEVTANGVDYSSDGVQFTFLAPMHVESVSPALGPEHGGTVVTLAGADFAMPETLVCASFATACTLPSKRRRSTCGH